jgi:hypothetical protein
VLRRPFEPARVIGNYEFHISGNGVNQEFKPSNLVRLKANARNSFCWIAISRRTTGP